MPMPERRLVRWLLACALAATLFALPVTPDARANAYRPAATEPAAGEEADPLCRPINPGMSLLMEILGPGTACPRGGCGYGLDGIPDPYAGGGLSGVSAARASGTAFPAGNASLQAWLSGADITGAPVNASDVWGYVSPAGREYAIVGLTTGTAFVEVTDPSRPRVVDTIAGPESHWRDMAVFGEFAYSVNERDAGIQVIDLSAIDDGRVDLVREITDNGLRTAHNIFVNESSGYAYLLGSNLQRGGLLVADLADPARPVLETVQWDVTYVHDVQVVSYESGRYAGREVAFAFTGPDGLHIVDVTDKTAPVTLSHLRYANATYGHSGWLSENRRFLYVNDELDERANARIGGMTTYVIRVGDLERPRLLRTRRWGLSMIDHNSMVRDDRLYLSSYQGGLRIVDISQPRKPKMIGFFDTHPEGNSMTFTGAWGVYAGLPSGNVLVSDTERGLFVIEPR